MNVRLRREWHGFSVGRLLDLAGGVADLLIMQQVAERVGAEVEVPPHQQVTLRPQDLPFGQPPSARVLHPPRRGPGRPSKKWGR